MLPRNFYIIYLLNYYEHFIKDDAIEKVIRELKASGLYENSVILVTTDNGGGKEKSIKYTNLFHHLLYSLLYL